MFTMFSPRGLSKVVSRGAASVLIALLFGIGLVSAVEDATRQSVFQLDGVAPGYPVKTPIPECQAPDNGAGTVDLPAPCPYVAPDESMVMLNGLPPGSPIDLKPVMTNFNGAVQGMGGSLGGGTVVFMADLMLDLSGQGGLSGFTRSASMPMQVEVHMAPKGPGPVQTFDTDMFRLQGQLPGGDPDFDLLRITGGTDFGMPSPGHTTLIQMPSGDWNMDSFFDITYRVDFVGRPGSVLGGMSGSTTGTIRMAQGSTFWEPGDDHKMHFPQLPDPTGWDVFASTPYIVADDWMCSESGLIKDFHFWGSWRGGLTGQIRSFVLSIYSDVPANPTGPSHPGNLLWRQEINNFAFRQILVAGAAEGWYEPASGLIVVPDHFDFWQYEIKLPDSLAFPQIVGTIYWLAISANVPDPITQWGWKSSLQHYNDDATWNVFSSVCTAPDIGIGTIALPAMCDFLPVGPGTMDIISGLPPGSEINSDPRITSFFNPMEMPGGSLGGDMHTFQAMLELDMTGTGALAGYTRNLAVPLALVEAHTGPRFPPDPVQSFPTDMMAMQGQIIGDPDFDLLRITAGTSFGMPSPGHTTLTKLGSGDWNVDSFFDITYRVDFVGKPGSVLGGMSGSTTGTIRMGQGSNLQQPWIELYEPPTFGQSMDMAFVVTGGCCVKRGDANHDGIIDIADLTYLVNFMFKGGPPPPCQSEIDMNNDGVVDIADLTYLVTYMFKGGPAPAPC